MEQRDFKGVWIPREIWLCKELSALDRVIFAEIDSLDNENHCSASNEYFAEFCGVGVATVTRSIQKLIEKGYIAQVAFDGRRRLLKVIKQTNQNDEAPSSKRLANNIDSNIDNKEDIITINSNDIENLEESDFDTHSYSPEELKSDFLGSAKKKSPTKRKSLYSKCVDAINDYTVDLKLQDALTRYLSVRLTIKEKPLYGVNQWIGLLNKLSSTDGDKIKIVEQSIEKGWCSFYPLKSDNKSVFSEGSGVSCEQAQDTAEERKANLQKQGRRAGF